MRVEREGGREREKEIEVSHLGLSIIIDCDNCWGMYAIWACLSSQTTARHACLYMAAFSFRVTLLRCAASIFWLDMLINWGLVTVAWTDGIIHLFQSLLRLTLSPCKPVEDKEKMFQNGQFLESAADILSCKLKVLSYIVRVRLSSLVREFHR